MTSHGTQVSPQFRIEYTTRFLYFRSTIINIVLDFPLTRWLRHANICIVYAMTWGNAEPGVYLIAACLLSLRPLFVSIFKRVKSIRSPPAADSSSSYRLSAYPGSPSERSDSAFGGTIASPPAKFSHRESKASDQEPIIAPSRRFSQVGMMHTDQDPVLTPKKFRGKTTITISASPPKIGEGIRKDGDGMGIVVTTTYGYESCLASEIDWENI
jgi:hypothetical protein